MVIFDEDSGVQAISSQGASKGACAPSNKQSPELLVHVNIVSE